MSCRSLVPLVRWCQRSVDLVRQQRGQGLVEYGMIIALVALIAIGGISAFGNAMSSALYSQVILNGLGS